MSALDPAGTEPATARRRAEPGSVDVVVVGYGNEDSIGACVGSAHGIGHLGRVVVVDHGDDGTALAAERAGARVLVDRTNPGFGAGCNRGARATDGEFLLLLNPDARVRPDAVAAGRAVLDAEHDVAAVEGVVRNTATGEPERTGGGTVRWVHLWGRALALRGLLRRPGVRRLARRVPVLADSVDRVPTARRDVDTLAGTALLVRRSAFEAVAGFDESYFLYGEDLDLCERLRRRGFRLVQLDEDWADHAEAGSSAGWWDRELRWWEGTLRYRRRWCPAIERPAVEGAAALMWIRLVLARPRSIRRVSAALYPPR